MKFAEREVNFADFVGERLESVNYGHMHVSGNLQQSTGKGPVTRRVKLKAWLAVCRTYFWRNILDQIS